MCRADNQVVGNGGQRRYLEDEQVGGLLVEHGPGNGEGRGPSCSCDYGPLGRDDGEVYKIPLRAAIDLPPGSPWRIRERMSDAETEQGGSLRQIRRWVPIGASIREIRSASRSASEG